MERKFIKLLLQAGIDSTSKNISQIADQEGAVLMRVLKKTHL